jgi:hypothetical protein
MTISRRERIYAILAALLVGGWLLDWAVIEPGFARWEEAAQRIRKADQDLLQAEKITAREKDAQVKWEALKGRMKRVSIDEVLYFVDHLWQLATTAGTSFSKTEPLKRVDPRGEFNEISYDVRLQCNIQSLSRFLYELDASPELLKVRRLQVTARPGGQALDVDVQISTLEPAAAPPPAKKATTHDDSPRS